MLCPHCKKRETKTPNMNWCNSCYVAQYGKSRPGYAKWGIVGYKAMIRDNFRCTKCKSKFFLDIHHLDGNGSTKPKYLQNNNLDNLIILCKSCHSKVEIKRRGYANKGLQGRWSYKFPICITCGRTDSKHQSKGECNRCCELKRREYKAEYFRLHYSKFGDKYKNLNK